MKIKTFSVAAMMFIIIGLTCTIEAMDIPQAARKPDKMNELRINKNGRTQILFDSSWRFHPGDIRDAETNDFNDSSWRSLNLPHDWSIEDIPGNGIPVDSNAVGGSSTGYLVGGTGWYRKTFYAGDEIRGKCVTVRFDGVYMNADIWLNGLFLGTHPYGYTGFSYDITSKLNRGALNTLAVRVKNEGRNTRWYSGSGIYRHVWIAATEQVHVDQWGTYITTPEVSDDFAKVNVKTNILNESADEIDVLLVTRVLKNDGSEVAEEESGRKISRKSGNEFQQDLNIAGPLLWSVDSPALYTVINEVYTVNGNKRSKLIDRTENTFGIRSISVSAEKGFLLNGKPLLMKGGCMHHDNGPLGAAAFDRAEERRVGLMKAAGFNAIRCSHNPPSPAFLEACDRVGILVIDEAFDVWKEQKNKDDYHLYFDEWWQKDLSSMILRDRNHPSVIMWSIGNEVPERGKPQGAALAQTLAGFVRKLDPTRPVTAAVNFTTPDKDPYFAALDVCGYNYAVDYYVNDHNRLPERIILGTESFPKQAFENWMAVIDHPWVIGDFVWTGYDYLGEASIGWLEFAFKTSFYPWTYAYCGDIDVCGWKRPQSFYRDALWKPDQLSVFVKSVPGLRLNPVTKVESRWSWPDEVASWNWKGYEGRTFEIKAYSSCEEVELFLNGNSLGRKKTNRESRFTADYNVKYSPGILRAVGYRNGTIVNSYELQTTGEPLKISLTADRETIKADGQDLCYVTVEVLDSKGLRNPVAGNLIDFEIEGPGRIIAVGSSDPLGNQSFTQPARKAFQGRCLVIIRAGNKAGEIKLKAISDGLQSSEIQILASNKKI
ncbi:MAG: glycoside hydrolase family 2 TIM barrel-domain containing protein [Bacteroidales bacterium]